MKRFHAIEETETSLKLTLSATRKKQGKFFSRENIAVVGLALAGISFSWFKLPLLWSIPVIVMILLFLVNPILYPLIGTDMIEVHSDLITVQHGIGSFPLRRYKFQADRVTNLYVDNTTYLEPSNIGPRVPTIWVKKVDATTSSIFCNYNGEEISLFGWVEESVAQHFVSCVQKRYPNYRAEDN